MRPRLGGQRLTSRIAALLGRPGPWTLPRVRRYVGRPQVSMRTLYRRVRLAAIWRRPKLTARGDRAHDHVVAGIVARLLELPRRSVVLAEAFPRAPVIVVICDNDSIHHARAVTSYLQEHRRLEVLYGARYSPHDNPAERIWAALKNYVANTAVSWPGRLRQIHSFFRARSPRSDAGYRRALDRPVAAAGLRAELLECRFRHRGERSPRVRGRRVRYRHLEVHGHRLFG